MIIVTLMASSVVLIITVLEDVIVIYFTWIEVLWNLLSVFLYQNLILLPEQKLSKIWISFTESETRLEAHHVQKKIVKLKMDKRPKKHRLSDINRKNVNLNKCITKVEGAPADYTIVSAEGKMKRMWTYDFSLCSSFYEEVFICFKFLVIKK